MEFSRETCTASVIGPDNGRYRAGRGFRVRHFEACTGRAGSGGVVCWPWSDGRAIRAATASRSDRTAAYREELVPGRPAAPARPRPGLGRLCRVGGADLGPPAYGGPAVVVIRNDPPDAARPGPLTAADLPALPGYRPVPVGAPTLYVVDGPSGASRRPGGARIVSVGEAELLGSGVGFETDSPTAPRIIHLQAE